MDARSTVVDFYQFAVAENRNPDYGIMTLSPWTSDTDPPANVFVLDRMSSEEVAEKLAGKQLVFGGSTFTTSEEIDYAKTYAADLACLGNVHTVVFQLIAPSMNVNRENLEAHANRSIDIMNMGFDEVIFLPELRPDMFRRKLQTSELARQNADRRINSLLLSLPPIPCPKELMQLKRQHAHLMWNDIPRTLMPQLKPVDKSLLQDAVHVGGYTWTEDPSDVCRRGATDETGQAFTIKTINKDRIFTPVELEGIYREFRFLSEFLEHPNLHKCVDMLHGEEKIHFVFDGPNAPSLMQTLQAIPEKRLVRSSSISVFAKLANALAYIHGEACAHRNVSLQNILVWMDLQSRILDCKLCNFESAMTTRPGQTSTAICGNFPTLAPEMASGSAYIPHLTDCWGAGIVLLEMAGGCGTLESCIGANFEELDNDLAVKAIGNFFNRAEAHRTALGFLGAYPSEDICTPLEGVLRIRAETRLEMREFCNDVQ